MDAIEHTENVTFTDLSALCEPQRQRNKIKCGEQGERELRYDYGRNRSPGDGAVWPEEERRMCHLIGVVFGARKRNPPGHSGSPTLCVSTSGM